MNGDTMNVDKKTYEEFGAVDSDVGDLPAASDMYHGLPRHDVLNGVALGMISREIAAKIDEVGMKIFIQYLTEMQEEVHD